jgi:hypothetical protein
VEADVGPFRKPAVGLRRAIELVGERPAWLEARLQESLQALDDAIRLGIARVEEVPGDPELAAKGGERLTRPAAAGVQRSLPAPDELLRQTTKLREATADSPEQVRRLLRDTSAPAPTREEGRQVTTT